jgi:predicted DNA binding protein
VVKAKVVAVLEIRFLDSNSQMTHSNNSHTEVVEEASLKAGGAEKDVAIGTDNNLDQILETVIIVANQAIGPRNVERRKVT